ncbi:MAG: ABC transporter substrate-binding protein [Planctomycetes bacterium]|nr:ABC transporter substrate-binding protein [Planctomycetota bacterium]
MAVLFGAKGPYRLAAEVLAKELKAAGRDSVLIELSDESDAGAQQRALDQLVKSKPALVAAGGAGATAAALKALPGASVVFFMVPNALDAPFLRADYAGHERVAGIASDIAPDEQIDWIARGRPGIKKVALLSSPRTQQTAAALEKAGRARGITIATFQAARDEFPAAIEALNTAACDGVLMIPDAHIYNSPNVERLLLWGVRNRKPVWTFSENVVVAGAFAGLYCDPAAVGKQTAELVRQVLKGTSTAALGLQYPRGLGEAVRGAVNVHTAEMIGAPLDERVFAGGVSRVGEP